MLIAVQNRKAATTWDQYSLPHPWFSTCDFDFPIRFTNSHILIKAFSPDVLMADAELIKKLFSWPGMQQLQSTSRKASGMFCFLSSILGREVALYVSVHNAINWMGHMLVKCSEQHSMCQCTKPGEYLIFLLKGRGSCYQRGSQRICNRDITWRVLIVP